MELRREARVIVGLAAQEALHTSGALVQCAVRRSVVRLRTVAAYVSHHAASSA
jgi:hypothetical protein